MRSRLLPAFVLAAALAIPSAASADFAHVVTSGESLDSIAAVDGLSVAQLAAENGLSADAPLVVGQTVMIPPIDSGSSAADGSSGGSSVSSSSSTSESSGSIGSSSTNGSSDSTSTDSYLVQPGDTLSVIAANAGVSVAELAAENGIDVNGVLRSGAVLQLTGGTGGSSSGSDSGSASATASSQPVGDAAQGSVSDPPYPTPERVSASQVADIASANGVPASLAQAVGWQESGFNNDIVSSADARGVMQILPGTWDWIQSNLASNDPLAPASASENVRGGVLLLHSLLAATGGDPTLAAAGYYQGLSSVRQNGLFNDTQQYVDDVMALRQRFGGP